jgi:anti-anti-sigma factor
MPSGRCGLVSWTVDHSPTSSNVCIEGELDLLVIETLREGLKDVFATEGVVLIDLSGVAFIDSTGLRLLLDLKRDVGDRGGAVFIKAASAPVERVLEVTGMTSFFEPRPAAQAERPQASDQMAAG